jgi:16S rRNA (cytosine967-C5)-methyltransferase
VGPVVADGRMPPFRPADVVLLDAPCTGTGTLRRHPDGRWRIAHADLIPLQVLQRELLDAAAARVRPGGFVVYSTCSLEPEENEELVDRFLDERRDFRIDPDPTAVDGGLLDEQGRLVVLPQSTGTDGSFAVRMRRIS